jgi:hypothetical protein
MFSLLYLSFVSSFVTYIPLFLSVYLVKGPAGCGNEFSFILFTCLEEIMHYEQREHAEFHLNWLRT